MTVQNARRTTRPGWVEIVVAVAIFVLVAYRGVPLLDQLGLDPVVFGLLVTAWSGIAGIVAFAVAYALRVRSLPAFSIRPTTWKWVLAGVGGGIVVWVVSRLLSLLYVVVSGDMSDVQGIYTRTGASGPVALVLSLLFIAVVTPIGEEFCFRGVVTTALLRYGPVAGVLGSAVVFAAVHGANSAAITAFVEGLVAAELLRRSSSIWPSVVVHLVNNLLGTGIGILLAMPT
jgi:uncharacterized protein